MPLEQDTPPPPNTFRRLLWQTAVGLGYLRAYWGRRLLVATMGVMGDIFGEAANQAFYARLPGHPEQAEDSLTQVGRDRKLDRFRGETLANWSARVQAAWDDYAQGGTQPQVLRVVNQWGQAAWPATWNASLIGWSESAISSVFTFTLTIPYGLINPPWTPELYGTGRVYGEDGFYYGIGRSNDLSMLLFLVRKWKPSRSKAFVRVYYSLTHYTTFTV